MCGCGNIYEAEEKGNVLPRWEWFLSEVTDVRKHVVMWSLIYIEEFLYFPWWVYNNFNRTFSVYESIQRPLDYGFDNCVYVPQ